MASPYVSVTSATFSDTTITQFGPNDIVVFVGPNNAGKSAALRNIRQKVQHPSAIGEVIKALSIQVSGTGDDLEAWLESHCRKGRENPDNPSYSLMGATAHRQQAKSFWGSPQSGLRDLAPFFVYLLTTEDRLKAANPAPNIPITKAPLTHPIHYMQVSYDTERRISDYFYQAFGQDLMVHRNAGNEVPLYCGNRPGMDNDPTYMTYYKALDELPTLHTQGDGMRSFVGVLLHSLIVNHTVILIDEPEAFLHPPQARLLGQMIAKEAPPNRQIFIGTHSGDFLRGLLDVNNDRVRIVRLQRDGDVNVVSELDNSGIKAVWSDSLLRYSNVLDGLFHNKVVICESDSDCRFYAAIDDALAAVDTAAPRHDIMFTHCGGKSRLPTVIRALRNLRVPLCVVADFDILADRISVEGAYRELGGTWDDISAEWNLLSTAIADKKPELNSEEVKAEFTAVLNNITERVFPDHAKEQIRTIVSVPRNAPWVGW